MTTDWWLSESAQRLLRQVDHRWPDRDRTSDGTIGDASHAAGDSDHNPDPASKPPGVVRAVDLDANLLRGVPAEAQRLADSLIHTARAGRDGGRLAYVIYNGQIASGTYPDRYWKWRPYDGDPHTGHIHVSFNANADHRRRRFPLPIFAEPGRLRRRLASLTTRIGQLLTRRRRVRRRLDDLTH